MKATLARSGDMTFKAATDEDYQRLKNIRPGDLIEVSYRRMRNPMFHRKYFAMLNYTVDNMPEKWMERYGDTDKLRKEIMIQTGRYTAHTNLQGNIWIEPQSIAFDKMEEHDFEKLYTESVQVILNHFMPYVNQEEFTNNILNYL